MAGIVTSIDLDDAGYQEAARRVVEANQKIVQSARVVGETQRQIIPATTGAAASFDRLKRSLDPVYDAQKKIEKATRDAEAAMRAGKATQDDVVATFTKLASTSGTMRQAVLAGAGAFSGTLPSALKAAVGGLGETEQALVRVGHGSTGVTRELIIMAHEMLTGNFSRLGGSMVVLAERIDLMPLLMNPWAIATAAVAAAIGIVVTAISAFDEAQRKLAESLQLGGNALGLTVDQMNALADQTERVTALSTNEARAVAEAMAATGRVGAEVTGQVEKMAADFGAAVGKSVDESAAELAKMAEEPAKAAKAWDALHNTFTAAQLSEIENAQQQGELGRAQHLLFEQLAKDIEHMSDKTTGLGDAWRTAGKWINQAWEAIGRIGSTAGISDQLEAARQKIEQLKTGTALGGGIVDRSAAAGLSAAEADAARLETLKRQGEEKAADDAIAASNRSLGKSVDDLTQKYDPLQKKRQELINQQKLLNDAIGKGVGDLDAEKKALDNVSAALAGLKSPLELARARLAIASQVAGAPADQRAELRARLTAQLDASQDPQRAALAGKFGAIAAEEARLSAAGKSTAKAPAEKAATWKGFMGPAPGSFRAAQETGMAEGEQLSKEIEAQNKLKESWEKSFEAIKDANLRANGDIVQLIERRRDADIAAIDAAAGNDAEKAEARRLVIDTASTEIIAANDKVAESMAKGTDATSAFADGFKQIGISATSAFEDAIVKGGKLSDVMRGLMTDIQRVTLRKGITEPLTNMLGSAATSGAGMLSSLFSGSAGGLSLSGGPATGGFETSGFQALFDGAAQTKDAATNLSASAVDLGKGGAAGDLTQSGQGMAGIIGQAMAAMVSAVSSAAGSSSSSGAASGFGGFLASLFGGGGAAGAGTGVSAGASGGAMGGGLGAMSTEMMVAHGAAFDAGNVIPFGRGGVVNRPTIFPMARGSGLMGESGPEAVLPLKRLPSGNLGVESGGSGKGPGVVVNIINNANVKVTTEEKTDEQTGGMKIDVMVDAMEQAMAARATRPGTTLNRALAAAANPLRSR